MPEPGYYKTNYRALRLREMIRRYGFGRGFKNYFRTRFMKPTSDGIWMPGLWAENECRRDDFTTDFWLATKPHRKDFEQLGFTEVRLSRANSLRPALRDSGSIFYLDSSRRYFGQIIYLRVYHAAKRAETNEITLAFTAVFEKGGFACTNSKAYFDSVSDIKVVRLNSYDVNFIHQQFLQGLQKEGKTPREFSELDSLRQWFDARQLRNFEERTRRGLFVRMTDAEVATARVRLQIGAPLVPATRSRVRLRWGLWLVIIVVSLVLQELRHLAHTPGSLRRDTIGYRGQEFKTRKVYASYEDYKDDPDNLDTNELTRIEQVMTKARVPQTFRDRQDFIHFLIFELEFPGYGAGGIGELPETDDGSRLDIETVEIPRREKERAIVLRETGGQFQVVDDFVYSTATNTLKHAKLEKQTLRYYDGDHRLSREKPLERENQH